jgi:hypothetical protein
MNMGYAPWRPTKENDEHVVPDSWGRLTRAQIRDCCYACGTKKNLQQQIGGFWFCFYHLEKATQIGASYWIRLNKAMFPEYGG